MKKHRIRRVAKAIKTGLTKVGLRKAKGLGDLSDEFLSRDPQSGAQKPDEDPARGT
jgi:hypothetical protein